MTDALHKSCPTTKIPIHPKKKQSETLSALEKLIKRKMKKKQRKIDIRDNTTNKKHTKNTHNLTKLIKKAREKSWKKYTSHIESVQESARINKVLNKTRTNPLGSLHKGKDDYTQNPTETLNYLADNLLGPDSTPEFKPPLAHQNIDEIKKFITNKRVQKAINLLKKNKSAGPDKIINEMIMNSPQKATECLTSIYTACIYLEYTPTPWKLANAAIIAKPGKTDYSQVKSYRIISLTSSLLKLLETIILWHLQDDLKIETALNPNQYGFRSGHSTDAILSKVVNKIQASLKHGNSTMGIFLDIQGAFDNLPHSAIKEALDKTPAKGKISNWIINMISSRCIALELAGDKVIRSIPKGCPQGGVLSPFLWNLVVNDLLHSFKGYKNLLAYADDLLLLQSGPDKQTVIETTEKHLENIITWCQSKGLEISQVKTQVIFWTRNKNTTRPKTFLIKDTTIEIVTSTKYLGVIIDEHLNWKDHINQQVKKCKNLFYACRKAIGKQWGLNAKTILWIYNAIILPKISYGCSVWGIKLNKTFREKLNSLQNLILKSALRATHSTPKLANAILLNSIPLDLYIQQTCLSRVSSLIAENHWDKKAETYRKTNYKTNVEIIDGELRKILGTLYNAISDKTRPALNINQNYDTHIPKRPDFKVSENLQTIKVFTDGSKDELNNTGFGYHIVDEISQLGHSSHGKLNNHNSVFQAEAYGIEASVKFLISQDTQNRNIVIYSDSQATIKSLQKTKINSRTIISCNNAINKLAGNQNNVTISWIPGHRGHDGNELADQIAKIGTQSNNIIKNIKAPHKSIITKIKKHYINCLINRWKFKDFHEYCAYPMNAILIKCNYNPARIKNAITRLSTEEITIITKIFTGHNGLNSHLYRIKMATDPLCEFCDLQNTGINSEFCPKETAMHILEDCPSFTTHRMEIFKGEYRITLKEILNRPKIPLITSLQHIARFFKKTKCLSKPPKYNTKLISPNRIISNTSSANKKTTTKTAPTNINLKHYYQTCNKHNK